MIIISNSGELFEIFLGDGPISESPIRKSIIELIHWCVYTALYEAFVHLLEEMVPIWKSCFKIGSTIITCSAIVSCPTWFVLAVILQQHSSYCAFLEVLKKNKSNSFVVLKEENILTSDT